MNWQRIYNWEILPEVQRAISKFKREVDFEWARDRKVDYLLDKVIELRIAIAKYEQMRVENLKRCPKMNLERQLINRRLKDFYRKFKKIDGSLRYWMFVGENHDKNGITDEMIARAREYPISNFLEVRGSSARCPFHDDKHPSMYVRGGYFKCYACGVSGDAIDFIMRRDGLTFREAVKYLAGGVS